jgi:hypothetical protein
MQCELQCGEACCLSTYGGLNDQKTPTETKTDSQRVPPIDSVKCVMGYTQRFTTVEHQVALALHGAPASLSLCRFSPHMFYQLADALLPQLIPLFPHKLILSLPLTRSPFQLVLSFSHCVCPSLSLTVLLNSRVYMAHLIRIDFYAA